MPSILIVDDSRVDRVLVARLLAKDQHLEVEHAENGRIALEKIAAAAPDVVVTDLIMPEIDGLELVRRMRREHPGIPVVLMTAYGSEQTAVEALESGAANYVPKDQLAKLLVPTLRRTLARVESKSKRKRLMLRVTDLKATFTLENDPSLMTPLLDYIQQLIDEIGMIDANERLRVAVALEEALLNAIYHGNLEITEVDVAPLDDARHSALIKERLTRAPYCDRQVEVTAHLSRTGVRIVVRDAGPGFDWRQQWRDASLEGRESGHHRGITVMRSLMDEVTFNEVGNEVTIVKLADEVTQRVADLIAGRQLNRPEYRDDLLSQFIRRLQGDADSGPAGEPSSS